MRSTWDMSLLMDTRGKIEEARGKCLEHLGQPVRQMIGQSFLPFIAGTDRGHFRRFLGQLGNTNPVRRAMLHLWTDSRGSQAFFMEAQNGNAAERYWIMLAVPDDDSGANPLEELDAPIPMMGDDDLLSMIEFAAAQATPLDLTVFSIDALAEQKTAQAPAKELAEKLKQQVERRLIANAYEGVVGQSAPGVYNVLHDAQVPAERIAGEVLAGAQQVGITEAQLGLAQRTVKLGSKPDRARIKTALASVKAPIQDRSLPVGAAADAVTPVTRSVAFYVVLAILAAVLIGGGGGVAKLW